MALEYTYGIYNVGQYPADVHETWNQMIADGWSAHTAIPNYSEVYIFWQRDLPDEDDGGAEQEGKPAGRRSSSKKGKPSGSSSTGTAPSSGVSASA